MLTHKKLKIAYDFFETAPIGDVRRGICLFMYHRFDAVTESYFIDLLKGICKEPSNQFRLNAGGYLEHRVWGTRKARLKLLELMMDFVS